MTVRTLPLLAAAASLALVAAPATAGKKDAAELERMLRDRVAGEPVDCIPMRDSGRSNLTILDGTALVYRDGDTVYVNRTADPDKLDWDEMLVIERFAGTTLCRTDRVYTHDRNGGGRTGVVFLEQFVPYKKRA